MNTTLEKEIEKKLIDKVRARGGYCLKWVCPGWSGVPDRICLLPGGRVVFVETKRPKGGRLSELQKVWAKRLIDRGFDHWVVWDEDDLALFEQMELDDLPLRTGDRSLRYNGSGYYDPTAYKAMTNVLKEGDTKP